MLKSDFRLTPNLEIKLTVELIRLAREEDELVHRAIARQTIYISDKGTYPYSKVTAALQSAACTAFDAIIVELSTSEEKG